jgi:hypothetical protein
VNRMAAKVVELRDKHKVEWPAIAMRFGCKSTAYVKRLYWRHAERGMRRGSER